MSQPSVALVGLGYWGQNLARVFHRLGVLRAGVDGSADRRAWFNEEYPDATAIQDWHAALDDPAVGALAVATPPHTHFEIASAALRSGRDVYVEKPLCHELSEAAALRGVAASSGRLLMVGHLLRYHAAFEALAELVRDGSLGELRHIETRRTNLGEIPTERNVVWNFAPHDLSLILALAGDRLPATVRCEGHALLPGSPCDAATLTLRFENPSLTAQAYVGWVQPIKEARLSAVGSEGAAVFDDTQPWPRKLQRFDGHRPDHDPRTGSADRPAPSFAELRESEPLLSEARHFVECCTTRRAARTDAEEACRVVAVLDAAQRSLETGGAEVRPVAG